MQLESLPSLNDWMSATRRRNFKLYNLYRLAVASALMISQWVAHQSNTPLQPSSYAINILIAYFIFSCISAVMSWSERATLEIGLTIQIIIDISFILIMMYFFGAAQAGLGLLLVITVVFASLISEGRYALFYASVASIGILLQEAFTHYSDKTTSQNYTSAVLLSLSCFATAWLAHTLAKRMQLSERLATERGIDIANLAKINALITQEMPNGVLVIGEHQQLMHYNQQFTVLTGLSDEQLTQAITNKLPLAEVAPDLSNLMYNWAQLDNDSKQAEASKLAMTNRDLGIRFLPTSNLRSQGAVIFVEDWSQIQMQAHQVKLAALGRLTANIAHEIRNPLSAISHANQLLQEDNQDLASMRMLQIISDNVQRLDQIIKDVLELNRRDRTNQEGIVLNHFVTDFYHQFCAVEKINASDFLIELGSDDIVIYFDRRHINQILWNLCKNGWRHCQKNSGSLKLAINSSKNAQYVDITVKDDGEGIAPSIQSNLFEPFITTEKTGTGLGLYIARELAEANGAKLNFTTAKTGTLFTLHAKKV